MARAEMPALPHAETGEVASSELTARFAALAEAHRALVARTVRSYARSVAERQDLEQEIALAMWRALPAFRGECSERTFVLRIAHNQAITFLAKRRRAPTASPGAADESGILDGAPDPEVMAGLSERMRALFGAMHQLSYGQRQVLVLALEGLSHEEIAEVVGITANNVAVRINRARAELKKAMNHA